MAFTSNGNRPLTLLPRYRPLIPLPCQNRKGTTRSLSFQDWIARYPPSSFPPFVSLPPPSSSIPCRSALSGKQFKRVGKLRVSKGFASSYLSLYLSLALSLSFVASFVTIKSKVSDYEKKGKRKKKGTFIRGIRLLLSTAIRLFFEGSCSIAKQSLHDEWYIKMRGTARNYGARGKGRWESCEDTRGLVTSEPAARRDFYRWGEGRAGKIRELRPSERIPEYNQPLRGVISVYPVIIVATRVTGQLRQRTASSLPLPVAAFFTPYEKISMLSSPTFCQLDISFFFFLLVDC